MHPAHRRLGDDRHARGGPAAVCEPRRHRRGDVAAVERGDVGRLGAVQEVAGREDARPFRAQRRVDERSEGCRQRQPARRASSCSGTQSPVKTTVSQSQAATVGELDRLDPAPAVDPRDADAGQDGHAMADGVSARSAPVGLVAREVGDHRDRAAAGVARVSTAEKLTCSAPTITARRPTGVGGDDQLLQRARGEHARRPVAGDESRRAGALPRAGGEDDGASRPGCGGEPGPTTSTGSARPTQPSAVVAGRSSTPARAAVTSRRA